MGIDYFSDEQLCKAIRISNSLRATCIYLKLSGSQHQYKRLRDIIKKYNIDVSHHRTVSPSAYHIWCEELEKIDQTFLNECDCWKDIPVKLGLHKKDRDLKSQYYPLLKDTIRKKELNVAHFTFDKGGNSKGRYTETEVFSENSNVSKQTLKKRYLKHRSNLDIKYQCDIIDCKLSTWYGKELNLQLDHINGINNDNRLANLRLLCPNCHSQTETFCGANKKI